MYRIPSPGVVRLIRLAAYQRAHGASWEAIARAVRRQPRTVRRWPMVYPKEWNRFYYEADDQQAAAAAAEARIRLQQLMRTAESVASRREAARTLARYAPAEPAADTIHLAEARCASEPRP